MAISDRSYQQVPRPHDFGGSPRPPSRLDGSPVVKWLLIINIVVWLLDMITNKAPQPPAGFLRGHDSFLWNWGHFSVAAGVEHLQLWRFVSFQFLHANGHHLLVNMLGLFFFGHFAERWWGSRRFLCFYLATGIAGALFYVMLFYLGLFGNNPIPIGEGQTAPASYIPMVGASAGIFGILACVAVIAPNLRVLLFFVIPMSMRTFALGALCISVVIILFNLDNAGGEAGHLGGAVLGFILMRNPQLLSFVSDDVMLSRRRPLVDATIVRENKLRPRINIDMNDSEVDRILDKVSREGLQSLTDQERDILKRVADQ
ncbi:MAG: rhomboid family intramembrane serine protease [Akkermansiaceae bacterium]